MDTKYGKKANASTNHRSARSRNGLTGNSWSVPLIPSVLKTKCPVNAKHIAVVS